MPAVEECVRRIRQRTVASNSLSQSSHVHDQPWSDKNLAHVCCSADLVQPFEGIALFSRKKEKGVSRNYKFC